MLHATQEASASAELLSTPSQSQPTRPVNVNLKARWHARKSRAPLIAGAARRCSPRSDACLGPKRGCLRRLGFLFAEQAPQPPAPKPKRDN